MVVRARIGIEDLHRYSLDEYHRLIEAGGFDEDDRVELLEGFLVAMSPKTPRHENAVTGLAEWLITSVDLTRYTVRIGSPLTMGTSEPEPDLTVVERDTPRPYHPGSAALVVEVAVSSLERDLAVKAFIYAASGVSEYWVLDVDGRRMVVHRKPTAEGYGQRFDLVPGQQLAAAAVPLPPLDLAELLR